MCTTNLKELEFQYNEAKGVTMTVVMQSLMGLGVLAERAQARVCGALKAQIGDTT